MWQILVGSLLAATSAEPGDHDPFREGMVMLSRAADVMGVTTLDDLDGVSFSYDGDAVNLYQGPRPDQGVAMTVRESAEIDLSGQRIRAGYLARMGEIEFDVDRHVAVADDDWSGWFRELRRSPQVILAMALENPEAVRKLGDHVVTAEAAGSSIDLVFDEQGRLAATRHRIDDVRHGDATVESQYLDYHRVDGLWVPGRFRILQAGQEVLNATFDSYALSADVPEPPAPEESAPDAGAGAAAEPAPVELAPDATLFAVPGNPNYQALVLETRDGLLVIDAPVSPTAGRALRERILDHYDADGLAAIAPTHHHGDHAGGLPGLAGPETRIHVPTDEQAYYRDMLSAGRHLLGWSGFPELPELVDLDDPSFELKRGGTVRIIDIGSPHADHHAIALVAPAEGPVVVFQADMIRFPPEGELEPARDQGCSLAEAIEALSERPQVIAGVHGRPGTPEELAAAIEARSEPCPG